MKITQEYNETFLECRDLRHAWTRSTYLVRQSGGIVRRTLVCDRCQMQRFDYYRMTPTTVTRVRSHYAYPEGYKVKGGLPVEDARLAAFSKMRVLDEDH